MENEEKIDGLDISELEELFDFQEQVDYTVNHFLEKIGRKKPNDVSPRTDEELDEPMSEEKKVKDESVDSRAVKKNSGEKAKRGKIEGKKYLSVKLPYSCREGLVLLSVYRGVSIGSIVYDILMKYLDEGCKNLPKLKNEGKLMSVGIPLSREEYYRLKLKPTGYSIGVIVLDALQGELADEVKKYKKRVK